MEELKLMRPYIQINGLKYFLNIMASDSPHYWSASYMHFNGLIPSRYIGIGASPEEALSELRQKIDVLDLLEKPVAPGESAQPGESAIKGANERD